MNKIGPNTTHSAPENRNAKQNVVTAITGDGKSGTNKAVAKSTETVALSAQAVDLVALETTIKQLPEIDAARVVDLHNRIIAGEYKIDADRLADKLLNLEASFER